MRSPFVSRLPLLIKRNGLTLNFHGKGIYLAGKSLENSSCTPSGSNCRNVVSIRRSALRVSLGGRTVTSYDFCRLALANSSAVTTRATSCREFVCSSLSGGRTEERERAGAYRRPLWICPRFMGLLVRSRYTEIYLTANRAALSKTIGDSVVIPLYSS